MKTTTTATSARNPLKLRTGVRAGTSLGGSLGANVPAARDRNFSISVEVQVT